MSIAQLKFLHVHASQPVRPDEDAVQLSGKWTVATKNPTVQGNDGTRDRVSRREARPARPQRRLKDRADRSSNGTTSYTAGKIRYSDGKTVDTGRLGVRQERTMTARGVKAHSPLTRAARRRSKTPATTVRTGQQDEGTIRSSNGSRPAAEGGRYRRSVEAERRRSATSSEGQAGAGRGGSNAYKKMLTSQGPGGTRIGAAGARSATHRDSLCWYFKTMRQLHGSSPILGEGSSATPVESSVLLQFRSRIQEHSRRTVGKLNTIRPSVTTTILQTMVVLRGSGQPGQQERSVTTRSSRLTPLGRDGKTTVCGASETDEPLPHGQKEICSGGAMRSGR
ncbi:hypothetical protein A4X13_0g7761 [Tilletia indica]|uniref:Uncharacterized protein n=1 Tax=Tilletia indica TaxID=43049 RepID=A0A8T8SHK8_9BASI|nr:hypothetical protein A4X13_0g7761 [Tilletia indica]